MKRLLSLLLIPLLFTSCYEYGANDDKETYFDVSFTKIPFGPKKSTSTITVYHKGVDWNIEFGANWVSSAKNMMFSEHYKTVLDITVDPNPANEVRQATGVLTADGFDPITILITQHTAVSMQHPNPKFKVLPNNKVDCEKEGGSIQIYVETIDDYLYSERVTTADWFTWEVDKDNLFETEEGLTRIPIIINVAPNDKAKGRTASFKVRGTEEWPKTITVSQKSL